MPTVARKMLGGSLVLLGTLILFSALPQASDVREAVPFTTTVSAQASPDDTIRESFAVSPGGMLYVDSDRGSITVESGTDDEVLVEIERRARSSEVARSFHVDFAQNGDEIRVRGNTESSRSWLGRDRAPDVHFRIRVPGEYNLSLDTKGGSISVGDLIGNVDLKTAGGSLTLGAMEGDVSGQTAGGSISLSSIQGMADLRTSGGSIAVDDIDGDAELRTAGGSITLGSLRGSINARTSGGSIRAGTIHELTGESHLETAGGGLRVGLAPTTHLLIDAATSVGTINSTLDLPIDESWTSSKMEGSVGDGGPLLRLRTAAGSITVEGS